MSTERSQAQGVPVVEGVVIEELRRENRRLGALSLLASRVTLPMGLDEILEQLSPVLKEVIPHDVLCACEIEDGRLVVRYVAPKGQRNLKKGTLVPPSDALHASVLTERRALFLGDAKRGGMRSGVVAPLVSGGDVVGTLGLFSREASAYAEVDAAYLQDVVGRVSLCLENHRLYTEMLEAKLEWEETFKSVQDLLAVIGSDGRLLRVNHDFGGSSVEEMIGRPYSEVFSFCSDAKGGGLVREAVRTRREASAEIMSPDLEQALSVSAYPVYGERAQVSRVVLYVRDVTAKRRMESQLFQSAKLAAIGEMAAGVAHELNSPLTAVIGNAGLLLRRTQEEDKSYRMLVDIKTCGQRCKKIISDMLTFARQDSYVFEPLQINDVVLRGLELIEYQLDKGRINLDKNLSHGLPLVLGNAQQVEQVVVNLILNARDALDDAEQKVITVTTDYGTLESGHLGVAVSVSDTGAGIGGGHLEKIFNPFFTTKEGTKGTGLGLSVSMGIAKAHGGTIAVESRLGAGSTFTLLLPLVAQHVADYLGEGAGRATAGPGLPMDTLEELRPALELARRLGRLRAQLGVEGLVAVEVEAATQGGAWGASLMTAAALEGLLSDLPGDGVTLANARVVARDRGIRVTETRSDAGEDHRFSMRITAQTAAESFAVAGAVFTKREPRLVELDGVPIEAALEGHLLVCWANDRPGLVGGIASLLAEHGTNIRQMRSGGGGALGQAVAVFSVDRPVGDALLEELQALPSLTRVGRASLL